MKYIVFNDEGEMPIRYAAVTEEKLKLLYEGVDAEDVDADFAEVSDLDLVAHLTAAVANYREVKKPFEDEHGNTYFVERDEDALVEWTITMQ